MSTRVILSAATVLDGTMKIGSTVFKVYITFLFVSRHIFIIYKLQFGFFCEDELRLGNDDFSSEVALSEFQLLTYMCYLLSASHGYFSHPPQY